MKRACAYCGGLHESGITCPRKPQKRAYERDEDKFRSSYKWKQKREYIKRRDGYMCLACRAGLEGTVRRLETESLSVHHIVPLAEDFDRRLDDDNLITLCPYHHELAESGRIAARELLKILPPEG